MSDVIETHGRDARATHVILLARQTAHYFFG